jgi:hypothetical protein
MVYFKSITFLLLTLGLTVSCIEPKKRGGLPLPDVFINEGENSNGSSGNVTGDIDAPADTDGDGVVDGLDKCLGDDKKIVTLYLDSDGDGLGDLSISRAFCPGEISSVVGYVEKVLATDTDDSNADVDADGIIDSIDKCLNEDDTLIVTLYADADDDGLGNIDVSKEFCPSDEKLGYVENSSDTDDELQDSDLDGVPNSEDKCEDQDDSVYTIFYQDSDEDGLGSADSELGVCSQDAPAGYVSNSTDTDDTFADSDLDGIENSVDKCENQDDTLYFKIVYLDADGDGLGDANKSTEICSETVPDGYVTNFEDYNDEFAGLDLVVLTDRSGSVGTVAHPDATETSQNRELNWGEIKRFNNELINKMFDFESNYSLTLDVLLHSNYLNDTTVRFEDVSLEARTQVEIFAENMNINTGNVDSILSAFNAAPYYQGVSPHSFMIDHALKVLENSAEGKRKMIVLVADGDTYCTSYNASYGCEMDLCTYVSALEARNIEFKIAIPDSFDHSPMSCLVGDESKDIFTFDTYDKLEIDSIPTGWLDFSVPSSN